MTDIAKIRHALLYFDAERYLTTRNISYDPEGNNVAAGWVGTRCPFCLDIDPDPSSHLGINLTANTIACWRCENGKGTMLKYVMKMDHVNSDKALEILEEFSNTLIKKRHLDEKSPLQTGNEVKLPNEFSSELLPPHQNYLTRRNFDPAFLAKKYKLMSAGPIGDYKLRVIIPFHYNNRLVSFSSRDITDLAKLRYKHSPIEESLIPPKNMVYNIDNAKDTVIIVEGPSDVWRIGDGAVSVQGVKYTPEQIAMIVNKKFRRAFILFDSEKQAEEKAFKLGYDLSPFIHDVNVWQLTEGDPADMDQKEVNELRRSIFGRLG